MNNELPVTVPDLNAWVKTRFMIYEINRAWCEFPFPFSVGYEDEAASVITYHRVVPITLGFLGTEEECCTSLAAWLRSSITREEFQDAAAPLFVRCWFSIERSDEFSKQSVVGRVAFWDNKKNKKLIAQACYKPEGAKCNRAVMPPWDTY